MRNEAKSVVRKKRSDTGLNYLRIPLNEEKQVS